MMMLVPVGEMGAANLPATMVPGNPDLVQLKLNCVRPPSCGFGEPRLPLPMTVSPVGTVMCISAVKRSVR